MTGVGPPDRNESFKSYSGFPILPGVGREGWGALFESSKDGSLGFSVGLCRGGVCVSVAFGAK